MRPTTTVSGLDLVCGARVSVKETIHFVAKLPNPTLLKVSVHILRISIGFGQFRLLRCV